MENDTISYKKNYLKYKEKYLLLKKQLGGIITEGTVDKKKNLFMELCHKIKNEIDILVSDGELDHKIFVKEIKYEGKNILISSLNIAQQDVMQTISKGARIQVYLRSLFNLKDKNDNYTPYKEQLFQALSDTLYINGKLKSKYNNLLNPHNSFINVTLLKELHDEIIKKISDIGVNIPEQILMHREIVNPDKINRFFPEGLNIDLIFRAETNDKYKSRVKNSLWTIFKHSLEYLNDNITNRVLICIQEVNPIKLFMEAFHELIKEKDCDRFMITHLGNIENDSHTNSVLIHSRNLEENVQMMNRDENKLIYGEDNLLHKLSFAKGPRQNNMYTINFSEIESVPLNLYNVHTNYYQDEKAEEYLDDLRKRLLSLPNTIIIGDMNLKISDDIMRKHKSIYESNKLYLDMMITPENDYPPDVEPNPTYDVYMHNLNNHFS